MNAPSWLVAVLAVGGACAGSSIGPRPAASRVHAPAVVVPDTAALPATGAIGAVRPWIGVALGVGSRGVRIKQAIDNTPGARAGLSPEDEILAIDGAPTHEPRDVITRVADKGVGARVTLRVLRAGVELDVTLALEARPDAIEILHRKLVDKPAPAFALADAVGPHPASLADLAGDVVVLEFGATWCRFCMSTVPLLDAWQTRFHDAGLRVVWISAEPFEAIQKLDATDKLSFTRARDPDEKLAAQYFVQALPTLVVIDRDGIVRAAEMGAGETVDQIELVVTKLLAQKRAR